MVQFNTDNNAESIAAQKAIELAMAVIELSEELPDAACEFAESIGEKCRDMIEWFEQHGRATDAQVEALKNMKGGCMRWLDR